MFVIVGRSDVAAGPHGTAAAVLRLKKAVCIPGGAVLAPISTVYTEQTECDSRPQESRNGCRKLLFGDGTVENTLDGGPSVSDSNWWFVRISQQVVNEFPGMWTRSTCCLENERDKIDVWIPVKLGLLRSLCHKTWFCAGSRNQGRIAREGSNDRDIQIRD